MARLSIFLFSVKSSLAQFALAGFFCISLSAIAFAGSDRSARCAGADLDARIAGCTEVIARGNKETKRNRVTAYINRATAYRVKGDFGRALADLAKSLRLDPKSTLALTESASIYVAKGDFDRAIEEYGRALRLDENLTTGYGGRARAHRAKGELDKALADFNEAVRLDPRSAALRLDRGAVFQAKGDLELAIADYDEAIELDPKFADALFNRAMAYRGKQDLEHAKRDLETALKLDPRRAKAKEALDEVNRLIERAAPPAAAAPTIPAAPATLGASYRLIVVAVGFALIAFAIWLFWLKRATGVSAIGVGGGYQDATVLVKRGYTPDTLVARYEKAVGRDLRKEKEKGAFPDFPHARSADEVLGALGVSVATGLSEEEAERRLDLYGLNTIIARRRIGTLAILAHQFRSPVVALLAVAAGTAFYFGELEEGSAIVGVLAVNALIGFVAEIRAVRSIQALRALGTHPVRVCRGARTRLVPAERLVPGDIVLLEAGDAVSADLRIAEASSLAADESTFTGESTNVDKIIQPVSADARVSDRASMLFKGTAITRGSGVGIVAATGMATELGHISKLVEEAEPEISPLEQKLARLTGQLVWVTLILAALIGGIGLTQNRDTFLIVEAAIALAVAAIPEGLPIVATLALARGMWRMARHNALIERLSAVETLGATTVILTDKTGTLTENRMTVRRIWLPSGEVGVTKMGFERTAPGADFAEPDRSPQLTRLLETAVLCNNATLGHVPEEDSGDPMELALLRAGRLAGLDHAQLLAESPEIREYPFDAVVKMMATMHRHGGAHFFAVKGAPEAVLASAVRIAGEDGDAALDEPTRGKWRARAEKLGSEGLRVLAVAIRVQAHPGGPPFEDLTLLGLIGLEDPPRENVPEAMRACREAGIRVVMITGDHAMTAQSIARAVGLGGEAPSVIEGRELARLAIEKRERLLQTEVFARVSPVEKLELVRAHQAAGEIVAVTGDGVNDAPALRQADIGVAMGHRGTDVAREAAHMVLLDDAFPTIVAAVREGRVIFANIRRFVVYLLSCNLAEVLVVGLAMISALPLPLLPLQILFLNLVTDVFPAFALAMGEGEQDVLKRPPRDPRESILAHAQWSVILFYSFVLTAATFGALALARLWLGLDERAAVTVSFLTLAFAQLWHVFNMRDPEASFFRNEVTRNPWVWAALAFCTALLLTASYVPGLAHLLHLERPDIEMWAIVLGMSLVPPLVGAIASVRHALIGRSSRI
jgi:Ca2+-transporting ATPase